MRNLIVEHFRANKARYLSILSAIFAFLPRVGWALARGAVIVARKKVWIVIISLAGGIVYFETDNPARDMIAVFENAGLFHVEDFTEETSKPHYPGNRTYAEKCTSRNCFTGVTLGFGFDAGARNPEDMANALTKAGIDEDRREYFITAAGKTGVEAYEWVKEQERKGTIRKITKEEALSLLEQELDKSINRVKLRMEREGLKDKLNEMQFAVLVSMDYNCPCLVSNPSVKNLWRLLRKAVATQAEADWQKVAEEIKYRSGSKKDPRLQKRRDIEAQNFLNASTTPEYYSDV